jgi:hypothetical protein
VRRHSDLESNDLARVTVRFGEGPRAAGFSFVPQDVQKRGTLEVRDFGTSVREVPARQSATGPAATAALWERPWCGRGSGRR